MRLSYYHESRNFGDMLNPYIFPRLLPGYFDDDSRELFLGIGTILGHPLEFPEARRVIVFSSGYAMGDEKTYGSPPKLDGRYEIVCVRGPLTVESLGLPMEKAVADGALLLKYLDLPKTERKHAFAYMPHHVSEGMYQWWEHIAQQAGMAFISPQQPVEQVIRQIQQTEVLITEAMHGAIVADVLRVPWIGVRAYEHINVFKWRDWGLSLGMDVVLQTLPSLFNRRKREDMLAESLPSQIRSLQPLGERFLAYRQQWLRKPSVVKRLQVLKRVPPQLSPSEHLNARSEQLYNALKTLT